MSRCPTQTVDAVQRRIFGPSSTGRLGEGACSIDPVLVSILGRALRAITDEMSINMEKTTRSPILCEARDFVTGLYDAEGRMLLSLMLQASFRLRSRDRAACASGPVGERAAAQRAGWTQSEKVRHAVVEARELSSRICFDGAQLRR